MRWGDYPSGSIVWADVEELLVSNPLSGIYQIVGHTMQFDGPIITENLACLDCRAAFSLNEMGNVELVTEQTFYEDIITSFTSLFQLIVYKLILVFLIYYLQFCKQKVEI